MQKKQKGNKNIQEMKLPSEAEGEELLDYSSRTQVQPSDRTQPSAEPDARGIKILEKSIKKTKEFTPLTKILVENGAKFASSFSTSGTVIDSQDELTRKQNQPVRTYFTGKVKMFPTLMKKNFKHKDRPESSEDGLTRGSRDTSMVGDIQHKMLSNIGTNFNSIRKGSMEWFADHTPNRKKTSKRKQKPKRNPYIPEDFEYDLTLYNSPFSEGIEDVDGEIRLVPHPCYDPERVNLYKKQNVIKQEVPAEARMTFRPAMNLAMAPLPSPKNTSNVSFEEVNDSESDVYDSEADSDEEWSPLARHGGKFSEASLLLMPSDLNAPPPLPRRDGNVAAPVLESREAATSQGKSTTGGRSKGNSVAKKKSDSENSLLKIKKKL